MVNKLHAASLYGESVVRLSSAEMLEDRGFYLSSIEPCNLGELLRPDVEESITPMNLPTAPLIGCSMRSNGNGRIYPPINHSRSEWISVPMETGYNHMINFIASRLWSSRVNMMRLFGRGSTFAASRIVDNYFYRLRAMLYENNIWAKFTCRDVIKDALTSNVVSNSFREIVSKCMTPRADIDYAYVTTESKRMNLVGLEYPIESSFGRTWRTPEMLVADMKPIEELKKIKKPRRFSAL